MISDGGMIVEVIGGVDMSTDMPMAVVNADIILDPRRPDEFDRLSFPLSFSDPVVSYMVFCWDDSQLYSLLLVL